MTDRGDGVRYRSMEDRLADADRLLAIRGIANDRSRHSYYVGMCQVMAVENLRGRGDEVAQPNFYLTDGLLNSGSTDPDERMTLILLDGTVAHPRARYANPLTAAVDGILRSAMQVPHDWEPSDADF